MSKNQRKKATPKKRTKPTLLRCDEHLTSQEFDTLERAALCNISVLPDNIGKTVVALLKKHKKEEEEMEVCDEDSSDTEDDGWGRFAVAGWGLQDDGCRECEFNWDIVRRVKNILRNVNDKDTVIVKKLREYLSIGGSYFN